MTLSLETLAKSGSYFIYDLDSFNTHIQKLSNSSAKLFFACKANPLGKILRLLNHTKIRFDVASEGELYQVLSQGISGKNIIMTGPAKSAELLSYALENQVSTFVIESSTQLSLLQTLAKNYSYKPSILLRLQLQWEDDSHSVLGGNTITPFGVDLETAKTIIPQITLPFLGFHVFQWGNILSLEKLEKIWEQTIKTCQTITKDFTVLDVGGGLGISYSENQQPLGWQEVEQLISSIKKKYNIKEFWLELGRYMTGPFGRYITSIVDIKRTYGKDIVVLEGGINHLARPALVQSHFPATLLRKSQAKKKAFSLHGPLCTALDFLGEQILPEDLAIGDVIIFNQAGAYGFTESMPFFLCHNLAGEASIQDGKIEIIREPQHPKIWLK